MIELLTVRDKCERDILLSLYYVNIDLHYLESLTAIMLDDKLCFKWSISFVNGYLLVD